MPAVSEVIERFGWLKNQHVAVAIWCEDDVLELAMEEGIKCSRKRAREIIDEIDHKQMLLWASHGTPLASIWMNMFRVRNMDSNDLLNHIAPNDTGDKK
jgi:hypothetical protein